MGIGTYVDIAKNAMHARHLEINSETAVGALTGELARTAERFDQLRQAVQGLRITALLVLLWAGVVFSRRLRAEVVLQAHLHEQIAESNLALEE